jgi:predicted nucleic acid-binding protein
MRKDQLPIGDAAIVENALRQNATLLTLDKRQAEAMGPLAVLLRE